MNISPLNSSYCKTQATFGNNTKTAAINGLIGRGMNPCAATAAVQKTIQQEAAKLKNIPADKRTEVAAKHVLASISNRWMPQEGRLVCVEKEKLGTLPAREFSSVNRTPNNW